MLDFKKVDQTEVTETELVQITNIQTPPPSPETSPVTPETSPDEFKPKRRGRPAGSTKKEVKEVKDGETPAVPKGTDLDSELDKIRKEFDQQKESGGVTTVVKSETVMTPEKVSLINGYMLLLVCDIFFPFVISMIFKKRMKETGLTRQKLKMTPTEKKELEPLADACAKELSVNMSATQTFLLAIFFVYAGKIE